MPRHHIDALVETHLVPVPRPLAHRPDRAGLGHPPRMADVDPRLHKAFDHCARTGGAADDDAVQLAIIDARRVHMRKHRDPHRRHPGAMRDALAMHQVAQHRRVVGRRKHQLRPHRRCGEGDAPAVGMEHRHDRQDHAAVRHVEHVGLNLGDRVDDVRAMLVQHSLGIAGCPAGVAQPDRIALVEVHPFEAAILGVDQVTVRQIAVLRRRIEQDEMLDRRQLAAQPLDDRQEHRVEQQHAVLGMVDDIDQLLVEQPRVHRMQHAAQARAAVPADQMMAVVHRQRRDAVALGHAQPDHRRGEPPRVLPDLAPVRSRQTAIGPARDDFAPRMFARGMVDQAGDQQRLALHSGHLGIPLLFHQGIRRGPRFTQA